MKFIKWEFRYSGIMRKKEKICRKREKNTLLLRNDEGG